jgi:hypothetical protein
MVGIAEDYRIWATPSELNYSEVEVPIRIWHGDRRDCPDAPR